MRKLMQRSEDRPSVGCGDRCLRIDRTLNRIDRAAELCQHAVAGCIGNPAAMGHNQGVKDGAPLRQIPQRSDLVGAHHAAVAFHVGCKNRGQPALSINWLRQNMPSRQFR